MSRHGCQPKLYFYNFLFQLGKLQRRAGQSDMSTSSRLIGYEQSFTAVDPLQPLIHDPEDLS